MRMTATPRSKAKNAYDLLNDVITVVREEPKRLFMGEWVRAFREPEAASMDWDYKTGKAVPGPACGTVGCVADWLVVLKRTGNTIEDLYEMVGSISGRAASLLGEDLDGCDELFGGTVDDASGEEVQYGTQKYVAQVVKRIRAYQKDHKERLDAAWKDTRM